MKDIVDNRKCLPGIYNSDNNCFAELIKNEDEQREQKDHFLSSFVWQEMHKRA